MFRNVLGYAAVLPKMFKKRNYNTDDAKFTAFAILTLCGVHGVYSLNTENEQIIDVSGKYIAPRGFAAKYLIIHSVTDARGNKIDSIFEIPANPWYWQWDADEMFNRIEVGKQYKIKYYGFRMPCFDMFPGITSISRFGATAGRTYAGCVVK